MSPGFILPLVVAAFIGGGIFYSYHTGLQHGEHICNEDKLAAQLAATQRDVAIKEELTEFQKEQIGEAHNQLELTKLETEKLREELNKASANSDVCIPDSVLDAIRKYRKS